MIGYWGYLMFEVNDDWMQYPSNVERTAEARYDTYYPINTAERPKRIFKGAELGTITFTMHLDRRFNKDLSVLLSEMVTWVNDGIAGELVIGTKPYGFNKWVCTKMVQKITELLHNGIIAAADVEVTLEEI